MEFRAYIDGDVEAIRARSKMPYDKLPDPQDFDDALVGVDESGEARIVLKAQRVAELYMILDHGWETPAMRWAMIEQAHQHMRERLIEKGTRWLTRSLPMECQMGMCAGSSRSDGAA